MRDHDAVDLELTIRPSGEGFVADARLADPGSQGDARLATDVPVALDPDALLAHGLDPAAYGRTLIAQVFADLRLRDAWRDARRVADGADLPLRLRLRLSTTDAGIHALRWETLRDPITDVPLATDARLLLVRSLDTDNTRPIRLEPKPALSALFVVANPSDLGRYEMAEIDVAGEVGRVQAALGGIALTVIGDVDGARSRRATLGAIQDALRAQPTIFCLMCHGQHTGDDTNLWLENNEGTTAHITGSVLTQILSQSDRPPLLVILIACEGGGKSHHDGPLAALGPRLAHTGVGAVLAMQDKVSISAATRLLPVLFEELARDGQIDRAVALARAALREGNEWWVPALWLRMRDGRLWADRQPDTTTPPIYSIPASFVRPATPLIGRAPLSADLRTRLCSSPNVRVALHGKPGAGKSRLALEIVADAAIRDYFTGGILVARLGVQGNSELEIRRWAVDLGMEDNPKLSVDEHLTQINQRISRDTRPWLVVVDDVWRVDQILPFVRCLVSLHLNLLITTRQRDELVNLGEYLADKQIIEVAVLEHAAAITLLRETAGLPPTGVEAELDLLVQLVGGLPLLLTVMGGYLRAQGAGQPDWFAQALTALKTASVRLNLPIAAIAAAQEQTSRRGWFPCLFAPKRTPSQPLSPRVIIGLSYDALPRTAQGVFIALAAFPSDPISFDLATANIVSEMSAAQLEPALRLLFQRSLLDDSEPGRFRMHHVLWDWAENHDRRAINEARRRLRRWHSDMTQAAHAEAFAAWRSHPDNWQQMINTWDAAIDDPDTLALCLQTILPVLIAQGYWNAVLAGLERAHEIFRKVASKRDLLALVRYYLGLVCYERAEYALAEQHTAAALSDFQLINSAHWQGIALSLLGGIHQAVGAYPAARACFEEVLTIIPETDEQNYATCLNNLANLFRAVGDYAAARPLYERALAIYEQALGPSHPDTASSLNNLAALFRAVGDYAAARPLYERALAIREQALGPRHPHTASSLNNLATLLRAVGDDAAARPLYERALAICEQALGPRHPHTASSLNNL
ncbi:MAG: tetratricopeptide repeat protein, partial [Chloroflexales bacterium]